MKHTAEGGLLTEIILETFKLNGLLVGAGDQLTKEVGLTSARWKVLGALSDGSNALTVSEISRKMGQSRQAVQRLANEMVQDGLLETRHNPHHERAKLHSLTAKGLDAFNTIMDKQIPWVNAIAQEVKGADLEAVLRAMQALNDHFS